MNRLNAILAGLFCLTASLVGLPAAHAQTSTVEYIHTDALGTPVAVTDAAGTVIERSEYEPYGQLVNRPLTDGPGFTGHVQDAATGLTYMQQRYYDPLIGRFLSVDPVTAYASGDWRQFNVYGYAYNNPYAFTDPDGRSPDDDRDDEPPPPPPPPPPPVTLETVTVVGTYIGPGALFATREGAQAQADALTEEKMNEREQLSFWQKLWAGTMSPRYSAHKALGDGGLFTYSEIQPLAGTAPLPGLTGGGAKVLGGLKALANKTVAQAIRSRGGGGSQVQQIATHLRDAPVSGVANAAAQGDKEAIKAIKMIKQAATKAERN